MNSSILWWGIWSAIVVALVRHIVLDRRRYREEKALKRSTRDLYIVDIRTRKEPRKHMEEQ
jgi:hypothetical protein